jgi:hypothetical protein
MGLGEGQGHSRPLQVYNMRNFPSRSECLALWSLGNEKELCGWHTHMAHMGSVIISDEWWDKKNRQSI